MAASKLGIAASNADRLPAKRACISECPGVVITPLPGKEIVTAGQILEFARRLLSVQKMFSAHMHGGRGDASVCIGKVLQLPQCAMEVEPDTEYEWGLICMHPPVTKMDKEDCVNLAALRKLPYTRPALWKMQPDELRSAVDMPTVLEMNMASLSLHGGAISEPYSYYLTPLEEGAIAMIQQSRAAYEADVSARGIPTTISTFKSSMSSLGLSCSSGMTRGGMIDALVLAEKSNCAPLPTLANLDEAQRAAVEHGVQVARDAMQSGAALRSAAPGITKFLISAGPGAGKTTTMANMIAEVVKQVPGVRVLVLAFNVEAERTLKSRLARLQVKRASAGRPGVIAKGEIFSAAGRSLSGCAVLTFDKVAHQICSAASAPSIADLMGGGGATKFGASASGGFGSQYKSFRDCKEQAAQALRRTPGAYNSIDLLVVDEAQDVTALEEGLITGLLTARGAVAAGVPAVSPFTGLIAAGCPRQEVYAGASWYSQMWTRAVNARHAACDGAACGSATDVKTHELRRNYRSAPNIVKAINAFSKEAFPTLHHDQVAVRTDEDYTDESGEKFPSVSIFVVPNQTTKAETYQAVGKQVGAFMAAREPSDAYGLVPVTLGKFGVGPATTAARQSIHSLRPSERTVVLDPSFEGKVPGKGDGDASGDDAYLLATSRRIKGTERSLVVAYAMDTDYDITVDHAAMCKLLFVALSRARDRLIVVTRRLESQRIKDLMEPFIRAVELDNPKMVMSVSEVEKPRGLCLRPIPVTGESMGSGGGLGLCQLPYATPPWTVEPAQFPPLATSDSRFEASKGDHDFLGCLAEAHVARAVGAEAAKYVDPQMIRHSLASPNSVRITVSPHAYLHRITADPRTGGFLICTSNKNRTLLREVIDTLGGERNDAGAPYFHAMLGFTHVCGMPWTVSNQLGDPELNASIAADATELAVPLVALANRLANEEAAARAANPNAQASDPRLQHTTYIERFNTVPLVSAVTFSHGMVLNMRPCRPGSVPISIAEEPNQFKKLRDAVAVGEADIVVRGVPIELKHTRELTAEHERQLYCYMMMCNAPSGILCNTRTGEARVLRVGGGQCGEDLMCRARALLALQVARSANLQHLAKYAVAPPAIIGQHTTAIVLDAENDHNGLTTEIGAVAISLSDWSILGTFQQRVASAELVQPSGQYGKRGGGKRKCIVEKVTRLYRGGVSAHHDGESQMLEGAFRAWVKEMTSVPPLYVHWAGSEKKLVGESAATLDVHKSCYTPWLDHKRKGKPSQGSQKSNLGVAMDQVLPQLPFFSHQAFEDAVATAAVLVATVRIGGTC